MNTPSQSIAVSAFADPAQRSGAMQAQLREIFERVEASEPVAQAARRHEQAVSRASFLKQAQVRLMQEMQSLGRQLNELSRAAEDAVIAGESADLDTLARREQEHRLVSRSHQRIIERLLPEADIEELLAHAHLLAARAKALRVEAETRIAKTAQLMAEAAEFEGHISFDPANTLSGALIAHAVELETQVDNYRRWAGERSDKHAQRLREIESIQLLRG
jgi:hypothetical protein